MREELSNIVNEIINDLLQDYDSMQVAAVLMINAFMIYGQVLDRENYKELMSDIFKQSDEFFNPQTRILH